MINQLSGNFPLLGVHHVAQTRDSTDILRGQQSGSLRFWCRFRLCSTTLSLLRFFCRLIWYLGLLTFLPLRSAALLLCPLCYFLALTYRLFFLLSSYLLSLFRVPDRHFLYRGQDSIVRSFLLKSPRGAVIQFEGDSVFFHELGDAIWLDAVLDQINNVIDGKHFPRLSKPWQCVHKQEKYRQNDTTVRPTDGLQKKNITFPTAMPDGIR